MPRTYRLKDFTRLEAIEQGCKRRPVVVKTLIRDFCLGCEGRVRRHSRLSRVIAAVSNMAAATVRASWPLPAHHSGRTV
jgi:hypothetical protein